MKQMMVGLLLLHQKKPIGFAFEPRDTVNAARIEENFRYAEGQCFAQRFDHLPRISVAYPCSDATFCASRKTAAPSDIELEMSVFDASHTTQQVFDVSQYLKAGFLSLFFYNCNENSEYSFSIEVIEYNINDNKSISYLSFGESYLPLVFSGFGCVYILMFVLWCYVLFKHRKFVHKIHYLMALLLFLKFASLLFQADHLWVISKLGSGRLYADLPYYILLTLKACFMFFVILLVGTGWSFIKPFLTDNEKKIVIVIVPLVIVDSIAIIIEDTINEGNASWSTWRDIRRILDVIACCAVLLPVVWSIRNLREASAADGKVARSLVRLRQFRAFYALLVAYIYFSRIVIPLVRSALHWDVVWVAPTIDEVGTILFFFFSGCKFQPNEDNPYLSLHQDDFDDLALRAEMEDVQMDVIVFFFFHRFAVEKKPFSFK